MDTPAAVAARADVIVAGLDRYMRTCHPYRSAGRVAASVADVRQVTELVGALARIIEGRNT
ncbi:hypothetical protein [Mycolicibacterium fortuitum]|uniref:Uncharacterized protein n=1 Tax=Mycolicibacterium fortuitum TaxID=1766 RepID=A0AAE4VEC4_MYCFO|nr:hypothetical protein [Mycolicibacterium fortuitum]MDV7192625.1 hypothetical protein [Mycolicibacterium fortuitum]MDV7205526.1 hypothetical protein [Mycolicibacterium fortuitum]MDV7227107.1 hypothetical protein [Mycolicibacterium fortuitum]MDV7259648.1 hypothetical protein [Mycolicibacterium fortuitum]MDV7286211.1 hypothetical protein [Mycolicibacterium fortuitum]